VCSGWGGSFQGIRARFCGGNFWKAQAGWRRLSLHSTNPSKARTRQPAHATPRREPLSVRSGTPGKSIFPLSPFVEPLSPHAAPPQRPPRTAGASIFPLPAFVGPLSVHGRVLSSLRETRGKMVLPGLSSHFSGGSRCSSGGSRRSSGGSRCPLGARGHARRGGSRHEKRDRVAPVANPRARGGSCSKAGGRPGSEGVPGRLGDPRWWRERPVLRIEGVAPLARGRRPREGGGATRVESLARA
jgi:hypothetical protein